MVGAGGAAARSWSRRRRLRGAPPVAAVSSTPGSQGAPSLTVGSDGLRLTAHVGQHQRRAHCPPTARLSTGERQLEMGVAASGLTGVRIEGGGQLLTALDLRA
jgi:hypothetical protein